MARNVGAKACAWLILIALPWTAHAQDNRFGSFALHPSDGRAESKNIFPAALWKADETKKNGNGNGKENGKDKDKEDDGPKHMRDNAILVEEASNQEAGVAQHIFVWNFMWDRTQLGRTRDFAWTYILELPIGSQKHQFSIITQFLTTLDKPNDGPATRQGDIGDTFLNYRYQLLSDDDFLWCSPRATLILPTADRRVGLGNGQVGYQFNLPVSRYGEDFDFHFNVGYTFVPHVTAPLGGGFFSDRYNLSGYNLGASVYWKPETYLHFYVESLALWNDAINAQGGRDHTAQAFLNPGFRYAVIQEPLEWVLGVSVPIGLTRASPDIGIFVYMSIEHPFRKKNGDAE